MVCLDVIGVDPWAYCFPSQISFGVTRDASKSRSKILPSASLHARNSIFSYDAPRILPFSRHSLVRLDKLSN